jgi:hypothetical protein
LKKAPGVAEVEAEAEEGEEDHEEGGVDHEEGEVDHEEASGKMERNSVGQGKKTK